MLGKLGDNERERGLRALGGSGAGEAVRSANVACLMAEFLRGLGDGREEGGAQEGRKN